MFNRILNSAGFWLLIFVLSVVGLKFAIGEVNDYKSFAEIYPKHAETLDAKKLGGVKVGRIGFKYRVMAECRQDKPDYTLWIQFIDKARVGNQFNNQADFSIYIMLENGRPSISTKKSVDVALNDIVNYCLKNKLKVKEFMHVAPRIFIRSMEI